MDALIETFLAWIENNPGWAGATIGLVAFLESLAVFGLIVPGAVILFGIGTLVGLGALDVWSAMIWCSAGAVAGDGVSFWLGRHYKQDLRRLWPFTKVSGLIERGEGFFAEHGGKSVFIGRFVGPIRPIAPVIAGMMGMGVPRYVVINVIASTLWSPFYILPGVVFGASLELASAIAGRLAVVVLILAAVLLLAFFLIKWSYRFLAPRAERLLNRTTDWARSHPRVGRLASSILEPDKPETASLSILAILLIAVSWMLGTLVLSGIIPVANLGDQVMQDLVSGMRQEWSDRLFAALAILSEPRILLAAAIVPSIYLHITGHRLAAYHWVASVGFAFLASYVLAFGVGEEGSLVDPGAIISASFYGFTAVLVARELGERWRAWAYVLTVLVVLSAAMGNLYQGNATIGASFFGLGLGWLWAALLGIAYRRHASASFRWRRAISLLFVSLALGAAYEVSRSERLSGLVSGVEPALITVSADNWWKNGLPESGIRPASSDASPVIVDYETGVPIDRLVDRLQQLGWIGATEFGWQGVFLLLNPEANAPQLPVLPRTLYGRLPEKQLLLMGQSNDAMLLRIWLSEYRLERGEVVLRMGLSNIEVRQQWYFFNLWRDIKKRDNLAGFAAQLRQAGFVIHPDQRPARPFR